ncbi:MAG: molybdopterin-guanine dinucleotide biosynthesis protein B [Rhodobacteraceae bacterium]|nr:molybdopterin-guanine dinucleotide biosynthesis protein B [Paracoccaceae bacterium]
MRLYGVTGWKNAGKTTLMERLVREITARGISVSTVKHAHHDAEVDHPGRDSFRHRAAGAREVLLSSPARWALMHELRGAQEPALDELLARLSPVDLVLIEGYKREGHPKIEAYRHVIGRPPLAEGNATIRAVAADVVPPRLDVPKFGLDDISAIATFVLQEVGL